MRLSDIPIEPLVTLPSRPSPAARELLSRSNKSVTYPSFSEEHLWLAGIMLKLGTQTIDVFLDKAVIIGVFRAPYFFQQEAVGKYPTVISYQL